MADAARLFDEWAAALARGERAHAPDFIRRAGDAADDLASMMDRFLRERPRRDADPAAVDLARAWMAGQAPLVELRARHDVTRDDVVAAVMNTFGLAPEKRQIVKRYYHRLEAGELDPARLAPPLLELLGRLLHAPASAIAAWRSRPLDVAPAFRAVPVAAADADVLRASPVAREPVEDDEEVRALFISER